MPDNEDIEHHNLMKHLLGIAADVAKVYIPGAAPLLSLLSRRSNVQEEQARRAQEEAKKRQERTRHDATAQRIDELAAEVERLRQEKPGVEEVDTGQRLKEIVGDLSPTHEVPLEQLSNLPTLPPYESGYDHSRYSEHRGCNYSSIGCGLAIAGVLAFLLTNFPSPDKPEPEKQNEDKVVYFSEQNLQMDNYDKEIPTVEQLERRVQDVSLADAYSVLFRSKEEHQRIGFRRVTFDNSHIETFFRILRRHPQRSEVEFYDFSPVHYGDGTLAFRVTHGSWVYGPEHASVVEGMYHSEDAWLGRVAHLPFEIDLQVDVSSFPKKFTQLLHSYELHEMGARLGKELIDAESFETAHTLFRGMLDQINTRPDDLKEKYQGDFYSGLVGTSLDLMEQHVRAYLETIPPTKRKDVDDLEPSDLFEIARHHHPTAAVLQTLETTLRDASNQAIRAPDHFLQMLAKIYAVKNGEEQALELLDGYIAHPPQQRHASTYLLARAHFLCEQGRLEEAIRDYETLEAKMKQGKLEPLSEQRVPNQIIGGYALLASAYEKREEYEIALHWYDRILDLANNQNAKELFSIMYKEDRERVKVKLENK